MEFFDIELGGEFADREARLTRKYNRLRARQRRAMSYGNTPNAEAFRDHANEIAGKIWEIRNKR